MPTSDDKRRLRMDAYYYGFDATGCAEVDEILSAVAWAGRMYHHTDQWTDDDPSEVDRIQVAANDCAAALSAAETARAAAEARATQVEAERDGYRDAQERACAEAAAARALVGDLIRERDEARAETERLRAWYREQCAALRAEVDGARTELAALRARVAAWERSGMVRGVDVVS